MVARRVTTPVISKASSSVANPDTGWKPMLHYTFAWSLWARGTPVRKHFKRSLDSPESIDRGRESECSPSLRTGQAVFQRPALQLMGSTVRLRASRFRDRLWRYRPFTRAAVRLNSPASSKKRFRHRVLSLIPLAFPFLLVRFRRMLRNRPLIQLSIAWRALSLLYWK